MILGLTFAGVSGVQAQSGPSTQLVPESFRLDEAAAKAIAAEWLSESERGDPRIFHGVWDQRDVVTAPQRAAVALNAWDFNNSVWDDPAVPAEMKAESRLRAGEPKQAIDLLGDLATNRAARLRAEANEMLGDALAASAAVKQAVTAIQKNKIEDPAELTEGVRAMIIGSRLEGQPERDYQHMLDLLAKARQDLDRLYWPAPLVEAQLLFDKDRTTEAVDALHQAMRLNPRCADGWHLLGRIALDVFDFDSLNNAVKALRRLNPQHPLADLLQAQSRLVQDDPDGAMMMLDPLLKRQPHLRPALALKAAAQALLYDETAMRAALAECDQLSPNSAEAYFVVGRHLSLNRQYAQAAEMLGEAIHRQPNWPAPQIELGLMEMQSGRDDRALTALRNATTLDQFNRRAANSLFLLEELADFKIIETEHFIIKYKTGVDEVMAMMMPDTLERIHATVAGRFNFEPPIKTTIELMPDHKRFSVRITGMPHIHTVAACTGSVIALETPRQGPPSEHLGMFDWPRVIQHEYTHTITLAQTSNRIPHWLTEGAAVSMEPGPRTYSTCLMLADSLRENTLFDLEEIKWAFVRPKHPNDRGKAYAQGCWIVQFMNERFGESALVRLLESYDKGLREQQAVPEALGISREQFFSDFLGWARTQVESWGLAPKPSMVELTDQVRAEDPDLAEAMKASRQARLDAIAHRLSNQIGEPGNPKVDSLTANRWPDLVRPPVKISDEQLLTWLGEYPEHPDLLEMQIRRNIGEKDEPDPALVPMLEHYAKVRPVDPFPHKRLAQIYLSSEHHAEAIPHLEELDIREEKTPVFAVELANLYRQQGDFNKALAKVTRAVQLDPYRASNRELAAAIAIEAKKLDTARMHIYALTLLEPDRPQHAKRLEAIDRKIADTK